MESLIQLEGVSVGYGGKPVLSGVSFSAQPGQIWALLGQNGCGKSTLLRSVAGLTPALAGQIRLGDPGKKRAENVAFLPQTEEAAFDFQAHQIVLAGRTPHSRGFFETTTDHAAVREAMDQTETWPLRDRLVNELSGGELQRVRLARCLAQSTPVLLVDEPTNHLDPKHQGEVAELLVRLAGLGKAILLAAHDVNWASRVATHCLVLGGGRVLAAGPVGEVLTEQVLAEAYEVAFRRVSLPEGGSIWVSR